MPSLSAHGPNTDSRPHRRPRRSPPRLPAGAQARTTQKRAHLTVTAGRIQGASASQGGRVVRGRQHRDGAVAAHDRAARGQGVVQALDRLQVLQDPGARAAPAPDDRRQGGHAAQAPEGQDARPARLRRRGLQDGRQHEARRPGGPQPPPVATPAPPPTTTTAPAAPAPPAPTQPAPARPPRRHHAGAPDRGPARHRRPRSSPRAPTTGSSSPTPTTRRTGRRASCSCGCTAATATRRATSTPMRTTGSPTSCSRSAAHDGGCWDVNADPARVMAAIADVEDKLNIDRRRVVIGGYSSGGDLSYRTAFYNAYTFSGLLARQHDAVPRHRLDRPAVARRRGLEVPRSSTSPTPTTRPTRSPTSRRRSARCSRPAGTPR